MRYRRVGGTEVVEKNLMKLEVSEAGIALVYFQFCMGTSSQARSFALYKERWARKEKRKV